TRAPPAAARPRPAEPAAQRLTQAAGPAGWGSLAALLGAGPQRPGAAQQAAGEGADRALALERAQGAHQLAGVVADAGARPFHRERVDQDTHLAPPQGPWEPTQAVRGRFGYSGAFIPGSGGDVNLLPPLP